MSRAKGELRPAIDHFPTNMEHDAFVKSPEVVMPDLIRHPEVLEITGSRFSPG
jgi:hypothetical protein